MDAPNLISILRLFNTIPARRPAAKPRTAIAQQSRVATPDEIARAVHFLASSDASYVNGIELFVDGGMAQM